MIGSSEWLECIKFRSASVAVTIYIEPIRFSHTPPNYLPATQIAKVTHICVCEQGRGLI